MANQFSGFDAEAESIDQRRKYAEALRGQALEPIQQQTAGGYVIPINPLQWLAKMLQAYGSSRGMELADQQKKDLMGRMEGERSTEMTALANALRGTPQTPQQFDPQEAQQSADQGTPMPYNPAVPGDPNMAASLALQSKFGDIRSMAPGFMNIAETRQNRADDRAFRGQEAQLTRDARAVEAAQRATEAASRAQAEREFKERMIQMQLDGKRDLATMAAGMRQPQQPKLEAVEDPNNPGQAILVPAAQAAGMRPMKEQSVKPLTEGQGKAVMYGQRAAQSDKILRGLEDAISLEGLSTKRAVENMPLIGGIAGYVGNTMLSKDQQRVEQAQRDFVNAVLRQESGAVIAPSEFDNAIKQYFPRPGDSKEVKDQKRLNREIAIKGFSRMAGPGSTDIQELQAEKLLPSAGNRSDAYAGPDRRNVSAPPPGAVREKK